MAIGITTFPKVGHDGISWIALAFIICAHLGSSMAYEWILFKACAANGPDLRPSEANS